MNQIPYFARCGRYLPRDGQQPQISANALASEALTLRRMVSSSQHVSQTLVNVKENTHRRRPKGRTCKTLRQRIIPESSVLTRGKNVRNAHKISQSDRICDKPEEKDEAGHANNQDPRPVSILAHCWVATVFSKRTASFSGPTRA